MSGDTADCTLGKRGESRSCGAWKASYCRADFMEIRFVVLSGQNTEMIHGGLECRSAYQKSRHLKAKFPADSLHLTCLVSTQHLTGSLLALKVKRHPVWGQSETELSHQL